MRRGPQAAGAPGGEKLAIEQTSGRQRINIHGAIDLETGQPRMIEAQTAGALLAIKLLESIEALYPLPALIHVFLDTASYHHARIAQDRIAQEWPAPPGRQIKLHFVPPYCPIRTRSSSYGASCTETSRITNATRHASQFAGAALALLRGKIPRSWADLRHPLTGNFRGMPAKDCRVVA